jgi:hypothetical protein
MSDAAMYLALMVAAIALADSPASANSKRQASLHVAPIHDGSCTPAMRTCAGMRAGMTERGSWHGCRATTKIMAVGSRGL